MNLNQMAADLCDEAVASAERLRISVTSTSSGTQLLDFGLQMPGGLEAGRSLAEICMASLGRVDFVPADSNLWQGPAVMVATDHPLAACMASQYAGWEVAGEDYFAMGSGPMRAAAGREDLFESIGHKEKAVRAIGVLESGKMPPTDVCEQLAAKCGVEPSSLSLLVAPTSSLAGTVQVVARSVETAMHKLFELGFDLTRVESGFGVAPLPPPAADDLTGIGRTNDAILYGGQVTLYVRGDDPSLEEIGPRVPSSASSDHGQPFLRIFQNSDNDFYKIDPHLFSPAVVRLVNLDTGRTHQHGHTIPRVIHESFGAG